MCLLVYITVPNVENARALARALVERNLAAGVNLMPGVHSVYRWLGEIHEAEECVLFAQVSRAAFPDFCETVRKNHDHEMPCIVAMPLETAYMPFLDWIIGNSIPSAT